MEQVGLWDENLPAFQDVDLWLRIAKQFEFAIVHEPLVLFHFHTSNRITLTLSKRLIGRFMILRKYWADFPMARKYIFIKRIISLDRAIRRPLIIPRGPVA